MPLSKRRFIFLIVLLLMMVPTLALAVQVGEVAPDFNLKALDERPVSLSDFRGRVVLLKLATTWCPTCKELSAEIEKSGPFLAEKDVVVLEIFVQDSIEMVVKVLAGRNFPMTFHALLDDGQAYEAYSVYLIPRLLVINPAGLVAFDSSGQNVTAERLQELVTDALSQSGS